MKLLGIIVGAATVGAPALSCATRPTIGATGKWLALATMLTIGAIAGQQAWLALKRPGSLVLDRDQGEVLVNGKPLCALDAVTLVLTAHKGGGRSWESKVLLAHAGRKSEVLHVWGVYDSRGEADRAARKIGEFLGVTVY